MVARRELADTFNTSERKIRTALSLLEKENIISIKTTNTHSIIKLTNWAFLQGNDDLATSTRPALDQHSTQEQEGKESKKEKKELKPTPDGDTLNAKALRDFFHERYKSTYGASASWLPAKWIPEAERSLITQHGLEVLKQRVIFYFKDPFMQTHSYVYFLRNIDTFSRQRELITKQNQSDLKPRSQGQIDRENKAKLKEYGLE